MIGISADKDEKTVLSWLKMKGGLPWTEVFDGRSGPIQQQYRITVFPTNYLVGPDGKIIAQNLRGPALMEAVDKAMADLKK